MDMHKLKDLIAYLSTDDLTVERVVDHLGRVEKTYAGSVHVQPDNADYAMIHVVHDADSNHPAHVRLELREPVAITTLAQAFGKPQPVPMERGEPDALLYQTDTDSAPYRIALLAEIEGEQATALVLRRDKAR